VADEATTLREKAHTLRRAADQLDAAADALEVAEAMDRPEGAELLGGGALIDALMAVVEPGEEVHYLEMHRRLLAAGIVPKGKDPRNTLLAALNRSPYYTPGRARSGLYRRNEPIGDTALAPTQSPEPREGANDG
jgi:hypothetical protein